MYMMMMVVDDPQKVGEVLDAWIKLGISGSTIVESTGTPHHELKRVGGRYFMGLGQTSVSYEDNHVTVFVVVPDEALVRECLRSAEAIVGDLDEQDTGILAAWPLTVVKGVPGTSTPQTGQED